MKCRVLMLLAALVLSGCATPVSVSVGSGGIRVDERVDDTQMFANPGERLACQMDYKCNRPLTITQYRQQRDKLREQIAEVYGAARAVAPLPPVRSDDDKPCADGCTTSPRQSVVFRNPGQAELPDPPLR